MLSLKIDIESFYQKQQRFGCDVVPTTQANWLLSLQHGILMQYIQEIAASQRARHNEGCADLHNCINLLVKGISDATLHSFSYDASKVVAQCTSISRFRYQNAAYRPRLAKIVSATEMDGY